MPGCLRTFFPCSPLVAFQTPVYFGGWGRKLFGSSGLCGPCWQRRSSCLRYVRGRALA